MLVEQNRFTKIIWSFESGVLKPEIATQVAAEQADAVRLVYDVGSASSLENIASFVKTLKSKDQACPPVMIDIASQVRGMISGLEDPEDIAYGDIVRLTPPGGDGDLQVATAVWSQLFAVEESIFLGYGNVVLKTLSVSPDVVEAEVMQGGTVFPHMDLHVPGTKPENSLREVSKQELKAILALHIDFLVVPGFVTREEIAELKDLCLAESLPLPWIIVKISSEKMYEKLNEVLPIVNGVLISRLEMALFFDPAMIPILTKEIIQLCNDRAKTVFTASEMLGSMRHNSTPTRAEVSDVANAVSDGADAVVLSEEVAYGPHRLRAVQLMKKIVEDAENKSAVGYNWMKHEPAVENEMDAVAYTAYKTAVRVNAKAIVCLTEEGNTAVKLASYRKGTPIIALTFSPDVLRRLSLVRGVEGVLLETDPVIDQVLPVVNERLVKKSWLKAGDRIVLVTITLSPLGRQASNLFTVQTLT